MVFLTRSYVYVSSASLLAHIDIYLAYVCYANPAKRIRTRAVVCENLAARVIMDLQQEVRDACWFHKFGHRSATQALACTSVHPWSRATTAPLLRML